jgi:hypothetical protein
MPITFSLRSVAWLGVDPANFRNPSGSPAPRHGAPLVYEGSPADEIQYLVHGCPQVARVTAMKGDNDTATFYGPAGEVLYQRFNGTDDGFPTPLSEDQYDAVHEVYTAFTAERAAGRLR